MESIREALIVVLPKHGRDQLDVRSYCSLLLLNLDYMILSKVLANRMLPVVRTVVHCDQNGFIPGRNTFFYIRRLMGLMDVTERAGGGGLAVSLDLENALKYPWLAVSPGRS